MPHDGPSNAAMNTGFVKNALQSGISWAIPALAAIVAVPIVVRGLGTDAYGVLALVAAVTGYLALMDLGLANGVIRYLAVFVADADGNAIRGCVQAVLGWFAVAGILGAAVIWVVSPWLVVQVLKVPLHLVSESILAFRIGGLTFGLGMIASVLSLLPQAFLRYDLVAVLGGLISSASVMGPAVIVLFGYGLVPVMWYGLILNGFACFVWGVFGVRLIRSVPLQGRPFSVFRADFLRFSVVSAANRFASVISFQTSRFVVGIAGGPSLAAYYQVPVLLSSNVNGLINKMGTVVLPTGSHAVAAGDHDAVLSLYRRSSRLLFVLNASLSGAVIVFSWPLLTEWVGIRFAQVGAVALSVLTLTQLINAASMPASNLNLALNRPKVNLFFSVSSSVISLISVYGLTIRYGVTGTALAGLLGSMLVPIFLYYSHTRILGVRTLGVLVECYLRPGIGVVVVCGAAWVLLRPLATTLLLAVGLTAFVALLCLIASSATGGLSSTEWGQLKTMLRSLTRSGRPETLVK